MNPPDRTQILLPLLLVFFAHLAGATLSTTVLSISNTAPRYSQSVTLSAVTQGPYGGLADAGTISFYEDGATSGTGTLLQTVDISNGRAQWSQKFMAGDHTLYAVFSGSSRLTPSTSAAVPIGVSPALLVPANGTYLGIRANPVLGKGSEEAAMEVRSGPAPDGINRAFALELLYCGWTALAAELDSNGAFHPDSDLAGAISHGRVPVLELRFQY